MPMTLSIKSTLAEVASIVKARVNVMLSQHPLLLLYEILLLLCLTKVTLSLLLQQDRAPHAILDLETWVPMEIFGASFVATYDKEGNAAVQIYLLLV